MITDSFVSKVTNPNSSDFVPKTERIAVFDNDGTLWAEKPIYVQLVFAMDRVKAMAEKHPQWRGREPFESVLKNDMNILSATGEDGLSALILGTHTGMTTEQFEGIVTRWISTARHPRFKRPYTDLVYQPIRDGFWST